jgi:hypothetical protein
MRNICADTDTADSALDHRLCRATGIICAYSFAQDALLVAEFATLHVNLNGQCPWRSAALNPSIIS